MNANAHKREIHSVETSEEELSEIDEDDSTGDEEALKPSQLLDTGRDMDALRLYLQEIGKIELLTAQEEKNLAVRARRGCQASRRTLIECNLRLVVSIARGFQWSSLQLLDLINEGNIGLMIAAKKFNSETGFRFSTLATICIRQKILKGIFEKGDEIRLSVYMLKKIRVIDKARTNLITKLQRDATIEEIAEATGLSAKKVHECLQANNLLVSANTPIGEDDTRELLDVLPDENAGIDTDFYGGIGQALTVAVESLPERQREVIVRRWGILGHQQATLVEVGLVLGVTKERVRQIQMKAQESLQKKLRCMDFTASDIGE